jgi:hypothetical protein
VNSTSPQVTEGTSQKVWFSQKQSHWTVFPEACVGNQSPELTLSAGLVSPDPAAAPLNYVPKTHAENQVPELPLPAGLVSPWMNIPLCSKHMVYSVTLVTLS